MSEDTTTWVWWASSRWRDAPERLEVERETEKFVYVRISYGNGEVGSRRQAKRSESTVLFRTRREALEHMRDEARARVDRFKADTQRANTRLTQLEAQLRREEEA